MRVELVIYTQSFSSSAVLPSPSMGSAGAETSKTRVCRTPGWFEGLVGKKAMGGRNSWEGGNRDKRKNCREAMRTGKSTERGKGGIFLWDTLPRPT